MAAFGDRVVVRVHNPLRLSNYTEPQPDVVLLKPRGGEYASKKPAGEDAFLVLEVADTTLSFGRNVKLPRYAKAGVLEVWIENLPDDLLLVYRDPVGNLYTTSLAFRRGESVSLIALPDVVFTVEQLLV